MNLLLLHSGALGDTVLAAHIGMCFKAALRAESLCMVARSGILPWLKRRRLIDEAILQDDSPLVALYKATSTDPGAQEFLRRFDFVVSLLGNPAAEASVRLRSLTSSPCICLDPRATQETLENGTHITEQWRADLAAQGLSLDREARGLLDDRPVPDSEAVARDAESTERIRLRTAASAYSRILLCHPGSGGLAKCCPLGSLDELIGHARGAGFHPAWMIGPDEVERSGSEYVKRLENVAPVLYEENVSDAAQLVDSADAYIGNDAGMTHVAALAGVPTIALFGPTDPRVWRPIGVNVGVVRFPRADESTAIWAENVLAKLRLLLLP